MAKSRGSTLLQEIEKILRKAQKPLSSRRLLDEIEIAGIVTIGGTTPLRTINARLTEDIRTKKDKSVFMRVGRGAYTIRERLQDEYIPPPQIKKYSTDYENMVLVFPTGYLNELGYFQGVRKDYKKYLQKILNEDINPAKAFFMSRHQAENDYLHKQVVSYAIVKSGDSILRQTRGARTSVSSYLRGLYGVGFGGHVENQDISLFNFSQIHDFGYLQSVRRELSEELGIAESSFQNLKTVGILNDESVQEGRKHLAIIHILDLPAKDFKKNERWINELQFVEIQKLNDEFEDYEYWSKLCILSFFGNHLPSSRISIKENFSLRNQSDLILIVGYVGSGKTEACALLEKEFGYTFVRCSSIMQGIIGCGPIEKIGRHRLQEAGLNFIRQEGGHDKLAQGIIEFMQSRPNAHNKYVFDGLRYPETLKALQGKLTSPITVLYVDTMNENLYRNHKYRNHNNRDTEQLTFPDYMRTVYHAVERNIAQFRPHADITIYNHGSLNSYLSTLRTFFLKELK